MLNGDFMATKKLNKQDLEKEEALIRLSKLYCASKRKTTDEELHIAREKAFRELEKARHIN